MKARPKNNAADIAPRSAEHGFTSSVRSAEHGFTSSVRSAEHGFTSSVRSAEHGFTSSVRSAEHGFTSSVRSAEHGFTLIELMVVIVILGLLSALVAFNVLPNLGRANTGKATADIATLEQSIEMYRINNLAYPTTTDGLQALLTPPASLTQPERYQPGGYIKKLPNDPWGRPYRYASPGQRGPFDIYSLGADGAEGGTGENADIGNWQ